MAENKEKHARLYISHARHCHLTFALQFGDLQLAQVTSEAGSIGEHAVRIGDLGNIPLAPITIEACSLLEHEAHVTDFGDVPFPQIAFIAKSMTLQTSHLHKSPLKLEE